MAFQFQFRLLLDIAQREGTALAIEHPDAETLAVLQHEPARLADYNIQRVPVSRLFEIERRTRVLWQASSSR